MLRQCVDSSLPSRSVRFSDEVMTLHLEKLIFIPHFLQAACSSSGESCIFSETVNIIIVVCISDVKAEVGV